MKARSSHSVHEVLRQLPYGLYVLGVRGKQPDELNAMVASWVTQCSFDPPLIMVAVRKPSRTYDLVKAGKAFSLNLIDKKDRPLVKQLVKPAATAGNKLGKVGHVEEDTGAPILRKAFGYVECKVRSISEPGDHAIVVGEVVHGGVHGKGDSLTCADLHWHYGG